jgi:hypothetical protein
MSPSISIAIVIPSKFVRTYGTCLHHVVVHIMHGIVPPLIS